MLVERVGEVGMAINEFRILFYWLGEKKDISFINNYLINREKLHFQIYNYIYNLDYN